MRRTGLPQPTTPGKILGDHAGRIRRLEFRKPGGPNAVGFYNLEPLIGNPVPSGTTTVLMGLTFAGAGAGVDLLDTNINNVPPNFSVLESGRYVLMARVGIDPVPAGPWPAGTAMQMDISPVAADPAPAYGWATEKTVSYPLHTDLPTGINTIDVERYMPAFISPGVTYHWQLTVSWTYVGDVNVSGFLEAIQTG